MWFFTPAKKIPFSPLIAAVFVFMTGSIKAQALEFADPFQGACVLQRDRPIFVWGEGAPGTKITVRLGSESTQVECDARGRWEAGLPSLPAGGPYTLTASTERIVIERKDILIGDVWLCSGQSNMAWTVAQSADARAEISRADCPAIRFITVPRVSSEHPLRTVKGKWTACSPTTVAGCSAVAYYFARSQWEKHRVPIGLVIASVGGSTIQPWISHGVTNSPKMAAVAAQHELWPRDIAKKDERFLDRFRSWVKESFQADERNLGVENGWSAPGFDDTKWSSLLMPDFLERQGVIMNGVFWLRKDVHIPPSWAGKDLILNLGRLDDSDVTYFNGMEIGETTLSQAHTPSLVPRNYHVPASQVKPGRALIAIRVSDYAGSGGMNPETRELQLRMRAEVEATLGLRGDWKFAVEAETKRNLPPTPVRDRETSIFFNGMIAPFVGYGLKGFLWYQGESNSDDPLAYRELFSLLIEDWRRQWDDLSLPFLFVQLAGFDPRNLRALNDPNEYTYWVYLREAQAKALSIPHTEMATAIDIGDANDIHPARKQAVGRRLSLCADQVAHKMNVVNSGPRLKGARIEGHVVRLEFARAGGGLQVDGNVLRGFSMAGEDRKFYWAEAIIEGESVVVSCSKVPTPISVRYAWADNPIDANLKNSAGLPADPFRLDHWNPY